MSNPSVSNSTEHKLVQPSVETPETDPFMDRLELVRVRTLKILMLIFEVVERAVLIIIILVPSVIKVLTCTDHGN